MLKKTKEGIKILKKMPKKEKRKTLNKIHFINFKKVAVAKQKKFLKSNQGRNKNTKQNRLSIITEGGRLSNSCFVYIFTFLKENVTILRSIVKFYL